jgi:hypothetical protein
MRPTLGLFALVISAFAQAPATTSQPMDEEFAKLVKEWTTKPEFMSPLVDHLPKSGTVPSPKDVLGYHIGQPKKLTYYADILRYYRALASKTPRVKVMTIGKTDEGRECVVVFVASDDSIRNLDVHRAYLRSLADPRRPSHGQGVGAPRPHAGRPVRPASAEGRRRSALTHAVSRP